MSEVERRRGYHYNRVLIESARILAPEFSDAVVFLSGAQIEMLRNITQYLNRQDTYVSEYNPGYYLMPEAADYDDILEIVADLEETLMGNPNTIWGYNDRWMEEPSSASTGEGYTDAQTEAVPAGYTYVLDQWAMLHYGDQTCPVSLFCMTGASSMVAYQAASVAHNDYVIEHFRLTLKEGDSLLLRVYNLPDTKWMGLWVWGYKMKVPEE